MERVRKLQLELHALRRDLEARGADLGALLRPWGEGLETVWDRRRRSESV